MKEIIIKDVVKRFGDFVAVDHLNLTINKGELFALLGVNGAGKTTTIRMLSTLIVPTSGSIEVNNMSVDNPKIKNIINISPQETAIAPNLTVLENLDFMAGVYQIKNKETKINELIKLFHLDSVKNKKTKKLSGGYQRRLSIAIALINDPSILYLDEPTLGLDVLARRELWNIINKLKNNITIILTTHYMEEAESLADRVGIMLKGKLVDIGTVEYFIKKTKSKNFEEAFIDIASKNGEEL